MKKRKPLTLPNFISSDVVLNIISGAAIFNTISGRTVHAHFEQNRKVWDTYQKDHPDSDFIEQQAEMTRDKYEILFGRVTKGISKSMVGHHFSSDQKSITASANACEVIAVYNALLAIEVNKEDVPSFPKLLSEFEKNGIFLNGSGGTSPKALLKYLKAKGYEVLLINANKLNDITYSNLSTDYDTYILTTWNHEVNGKANLMSGIHTMCITKGYVMHNDFGKTGQKAFPSLQEAVNAYGGKPICLIGIRKD